MDTLIEQERGRQVFLVRTKAFDGETYPLAVPGANGYALPIEHIGVRFASGTLLRTDVSAGGPELCYFENYVAEGRSTQAIRIDDRLYGMPTPFVCPECCNCTLLDAEMADPDGINVIEEWALYHVQDEVLESEQRDDDGSTITCSGKDRTSREVPCRRVASDVSVDLAEVVAYSVVVDPGGTYQKQLSHLGSPDEYYGQTTPVGIGATLTETSLTIRDTLFGTSATYEPATAPTWIAGRGIAWASLQAPITYNFVSGDLAAAPATIQVGSPLWAGRFHGVAWWRWYEATQWQPDGLALPSFGWCHDGYSLQSHIEDLNGMVTDYPTGQAVFRLAMRQGDHKAFANSGPDWYTTWWDNTWFQNGFPARVIDEITWTEFDEDMLDVVYEPDLSETAEPITFGIMRDVRASGGIKIVQEDTRLDRFCFRRIDQ